MTSWSLKKNRLITSIFIVVGFLISIAGGTRFAYAEATPIGSLEGTATGYEGEISDGVWNPAIKNYPATAFPDAMTTAGTAAAPLPQGALLTFSLIENEAHNIELQVNAKPTTIDTDYTTDPGDKFGEVHTAVYIKKSTEVSDSAYKLVKNGASDYFKTGSKDADEAPLVLPINELDADTTYTIKLVSRYYYDTGGVADGHIPPVVVSVTTASSEPLPIGDLGTAKGYEGGILLGESSSILSGPVGGVGVYPTAGSELPDVFIDPPTLTDDDCADDSSTADDNAELKSCEGVSVAYSLTEITPSSFKFTYQVTPTTEDNDVEGAADLKELYFWTYIKKTGETDDKYVRVEDGGAKYFHYDYAVDGDGVGQVTITTLYTNTDYTIKILGLYYYNEFNVNDGHVLPIVFPLKTAEAATAEEAAALDAAAAGGPTGAFVAAGFNTFCLSFVKAPYISLAGCFAELFQSVLFPLVAGVAYIFGGFLDIMAKFTLGSEAYGDAVSFIQTGWTLVRDFSNILFIVALVYLAFGVIFDLHNVHVKKSIASIVIMALMVNFSLFFTKVIIDTSNILANIFYTQISVTGVEDFEVGDGEAPPVQISRGIISGFNPQQMISPETQMKLSEDISKGADANRIVLILYLMGTVMLALASWAFLVTGLNFVQRTISLWLAMIFAPFAFVSLAFPFGLSGLKRIGWHSWLKDLLCWCFYAPLFMFFVYLIITFADSNFLDGFVENVGSYGIFEFLVYITMPFVIMITLLIYAKNLAKSMGCDGADAFVSAGTKIVAGAAGVGIMALSGGAAAIGRRTMGARAAGQLNSAEGNDLKKAAAGDPAGLLAMRSKKGYEGLSEVAAQKKAEAEVRRLQKQSTRSYDFRQSKAGNAISGALGINMNAGAGAMNTLTGGKARFSTADTTGGFLASQDRKYKERKEFIDSLGIDHEEVHKQDNIIDTGKEGKKETRNAAGQLIDEHGAVIPDHNRGADGKITSFNPVADMSMGTLEEVTERLENLKQQVKSGALTAGDPELNALQTEKNRRNKEIALAERAKAKAEKGYTKTYAKFLERNPRGQANSDQAAQDVSAKASLRNLFSATNTRRAGEQAAIGAAIGAGVMGPLGAGIGGVVGGLKGFTQDLRGGVSNWIKASTREFGSELDTVFKTDLSGIDARNRLATNLKDSHYHAGHYTDNYKPAMKEFFKFFENLSKGGLEIKGGGGGGSHGGGGHGGGGHDSHGGGGHH